MNLHPAAPAADLLKGPDDVRAWIRLDRLTRRLVGCRGLERDAKNRNQEKGCLE